MHVISRKALQDFWTEHPAAKKPLTLWYREATAAAWASPADVKAQYGNASIVRECVVFNIGGNKYRLVTWINYAAQVVLIKGVFTHVEYDERTLDCRAP